MKKFLDVIKTIFGVIIGAVIYLMLLPIIIITLPFVYFKRKNLNNKYFQFQKEHNNQNFFCYNNRKNVKEYIENEIIPNLDKSVEIVFLNGKIIENNKFPKSFLSAALSRFKNYSRFPHLMKIRDGKLIDKSINSIFYAIINQGRQKELLMNEINIFFELE